METNVQAHFNVKRAKTHATNTAIFSNEKSFFHYNQIFKPHLLCQIICIKMALLCSYINLQSIIQRFDVCIVHRRKILTLFRHLQGRAVWPQCHCLSPHLHASQEGLELPCPHLWRSHIRCKCSLSQGMHCQSLHFAGEANKVKCYKMVNDQKRWSFHDLTSKKLHCNFDSGSKGNLLEF